MRSPSNRPTHKPDADVKGVWMDTDDAPHHLNTTAATQAQERLMPCHPGHCATLVGPSQHLQYTSASKEGCCGWPNKQCNNEPKKQHKTSTHTTHFVTIVCVFVLVCRYCCLSFVLSCRCALLSGAVVCCCGGCFDCCFSECLRLPSASLFCCLVCSCAYLRRVGCVSAVCCLLALLTARRRDAQRKKRGRA